MTSIPGVFVTFLGGYIYDIFGRKFSIYFMLLFGGATFAFIPFLAPNQNGFIVSVMAMNFFFNPLGFTPII